MASAYSQPRQYSGYLEEYNKEFLAAAMGAKQGAYNQGRARAQEAYNQYSNLDLLKDEDKAYFKDNLYQLNEQVKMAGMGDLSQAGVVDNLTSYYSKAMDENVLNAYAGTKTIRKIQEEAEASKKDGKYSDLNYSYSMEAANKWASDGKVGSKYEGNSTYVPYTNIVEIATKQIKDLVPNGYVRMNPTGNGLSYYKENGEEVTESRILQLLDATMMTDPNVSQQIGVNAWGAYGKLADNDFVNLVQTSYSDKVAQYDAEIKKQRQSLLGAKGENRTNIEETIAYLEKNKKQYTDVDKNSAESILKSRVGLERQFYTNDFLSGIAEAYAYNSVKDKGFVADPGAVAIWKNKQENIRHQDDLDLEREKINSNNALKIVEAFQKNRDPEEALQVANALGVNPKYASRLFATPTMTSGEIKTDQVKATVAKESIQNHKLSATTMFRATEKEIASFFTEAGKSEFGSTKEEDNYKLSKVKLTEKEWNTYLANKLVKGSYLNYETAWEELKNAKRTKLAADGMQVKAQKLIAEGLDVRTKTYINKELPEILDNLEKNPGNVQKLDTDIFKGQNIYRVPESIDVSYDNGKYTLSSYVSSGELVRSSVAKKREVIGVFDTKEDLENYLSQGAHVSDIDDIEEKVYLKIYEQNMKSTTPTTIGNTDVSSSAFMEMLFSQIDPSVLDKDKYRQTIASSTKEGESPKYVKGERQYDYTGTDIHNVGNGMLLLQKGETSDLININSLQGHVKEVLGGVDYTQSEEEKEAYVEDYYMDRIATNGSEIIKEETLFVGKGVADGKEVTFDIQYDFFKGRGVKPLLVMLDKEGNELKQMYLSNSPTTLFNAKMIGTNITTREINQLTR